MNDADERRLCTRTRFVTTVVVNSGTDNIEVEAELRDISIIGMFVTTDVLFEEESKCDVKIVIRGNNSKLVLENIQAIVVRNGDCGVALRFVSNMEWFVLFKIYTHYSKDGTVGWTEGDRDRRREDDVVSGSVYDRRRNSN